MVTIQDQTLYFVTQSPAGCSFNSDVEYVPAVLSANSVNFHPCVSLSNIPSKQYTVCAPKNKEASYDDYNTCLRYSADASQCTAQDTCQFINFGSFDYHKGDADTATTIRKSLLYSINPPDLKTGIDYVGNYCGSFDETSLPGGIKIVSQQIDNCDQDPVQQGLYCVLNRPTFKMKILFRKKN